MSDPAAAPETDPQPPTATSPAASSQSAGAPVLPADPEAYDSARASQARARGLAAPYIAGGEDPHPEATRRRERPLLIALIVMIVLVVLSGFVLGVIQNLLGF